MFRTIAAPVLLLSAVAACVPPDESGSVRAWMFVRDESTNGYHLAIDTVDNLESLRELRGRDVDVRRGATLSDVLGSNGPGLDVDEGSPFSLEYSMESGVVVPADLDSFHAVTLYRNLDRIASLLRAHGYQPLRRLQVYYLPRVENPVLGDERLLITDNAAYVSEAKGFLIVPSFVLSALPMVLNEGVLAHEFGHSVIHQQLFGDAADAPHASDPASEWQIAAHHLAAMHEGVADVFGFAATGDRDFIRPTADADRNMAEPRDFTDKEKSDIEALPAADQLFGANFDPHAPGSILARAVFEAWPKDAHGKVTPEERGRLIDATLASLKRIHDGGLYDPAKKFTLVTFLDGLALQVTDDARANMCAVFRKRFHPLAKSFSVCGEP